MREDAGSRVEAGSARIDKRVTAVKRAAAAPTAPLQEPETATFASDAAIDFRTECIQPELARRPDGATARGRRRPDARTEQKPAHANTLNHEEVPPDGGESHSNEIVARSFLLLHKDAQCSRFRYLDERPLMQRTHRSRRTPLRSGRWQRRPAARAARPL